VAISLDDGTTEAIARIESHDTYKDLFYRLSLAENTHLAPPYTSLFEEWSDLPRQLWRKCKKNLGYPSTQDVGILGDYIKQLRQQAEEHLGEPISIAAAAFPNLIALYLEDVKDAFEWAGLNYEAFHSHHPMRAVSGQYAANGFGLCSNYKVKELCKEEDKQLPIQRTVNIEFTKEALIVEVPLMRVARSSILYPSDTFVDFELGYNGRDVSPKYWDSVKARIVNFFKYHNAENWNDSWTPSKVFVVGDESVQDEHFRSVITDACFWKKDELQFFDDDVFFKTAKGTAELARRQLYSRG
jgi:hypothetical protein